MAILVPSAVLCALLILYPSGSAIAFANFKMWEAFQAVFGWLPHAEEFTPGRLERVWNVVMFIPLGFALVLLLPRWWWAAVLVLASVGIESVQFLFYNGARLPEAWDVVTNSLGGFVGVGAGFIVLWLFRPEPEDPV